MNNEQYENLISLMKEALKFYADKGNYSGAMGTIAPIDSDEYGSQARFALKKCDDLEKQLQEMVDDFEKELLNMDNDEDVDSNLVNQILMDIKKLKDVNENI